MYTAQLSQEIGPLPSDRRTYQRVRLVCTAVFWLAPSFDEEIAYAPTGGGGSMRVVQVDSLSMGGLSFVSTTAVPLGASIWVRVRLGARTCQFKGVVRRESTVVHAGRTQHRCGVQFLRSQQTAHAVAIVSNFMEIASLRQSH